MERGKLRGMNGGSGMEKKKCEKKVDRIASGVEEGVREVVLKEKEWRKYVGKKGNWKKCEKKVDCIGSVYMERVREDEWNEKWRKCVGKNV